MESSAPCKKIMDDHARVKVFEIFVGVLDRLRA